MEVRERQQVVQCIVMEQGREDQVLMGKRKRDDYWEFLGGKLEKGEDVIEAGIRELSEETGLDLSMDNVVEHRDGESYRSKDDGQYVLNPLKLVFRKDTFEEIKVSEMPDHSKYEWVDLKEFYSYDTLGQYQALENLGIVNGDVAIAVPFNGEKYLLMKRGPSNTSSGFWAFPGGKIEDVEEGKGAVLRELEEETQLNGTIEHSGKPYIDEGQLGFWRIFPYLVKVSQDAKAVPDADHSAHEWVDLEDLEEKETLGEKKSIENLDLK
jgi:8-oxo-dGTP pyrophosphatase MutT (NUDIX family)